MIGLRGRRQAVIEFSLLGRCLVALRTRAERSHAHTRTRARVFWDGALTLVGSVLLAASSRRLARLLYLMRRCSSIIRSCLMYASDFSRDFSLDSMAC